MALNEDAYIKKNPEHIYNFRYLCRFMHTTAISQQNKKNALLLKKLEHFKCLCNRLGALEKDAINTARKVRRTSERSVYKISTQMQKQSLGVLLW